MASIDVDSIASRFNPLVVAVLRTPIFHWLLSPGLMLIQVTGRRSGRRYTIPVGYRRDGRDLIVLVSEARKKQWWRNFCEEQPAEVRLRGSAQRGNVLALEPGSDDFASQLEDALRRLPGMARVFGVTGYDREAGPTVAQHHYLSQQVAVVRIRLDAT
jgi:deazaflavin-dependent oxidoreductase (nitroreductase family)